MRLNRYLASAGLGSRRSCEGLILEGRVTVNGDICRQLATIVGDADKVTVDGMPVVPQRHLTVLLNKPRGYLCTAQDTEGRKTMFDLFPANWPRLFHIGRLDRDSEGLILATNDGELSLRLTHPRFKVDKEYEVKLDRPFKIEDAEKLRAGFHIEGGRAWVESVRREGSNFLRMVLRQGIKRQIRLMLYALGYEVENLRRVRIGPLGIGPLKEGAWRILEPKEIAALLEAGIAPARPAGEPAPAVREGGARPVRRELREGEKTRHGFRHERRGAPSHGRGAGYGAQGTHGAEGAKGERGARRQAEAPRRYSGAKPGETPGDQHVQPADQRSHSGHRSGEKPGGPWKKGGGSWRKPGSSGSKSGGYAGKSGGQGGPAERRGQSGSERGSGGGGSGSGGFAKPNAGRGKPWLRQPPQKSPGGGYSFKRKK